MSKDEGFDSSPTPAVFLTGNPAAERRVEGNPTRAEARVHGIERDLQAIGDLRRRHAMHLDEGEHLALARVELAYQIFEKLGRFVLLGELERRRLRLLLGLDVQRKHD